jgi:diguanylate cyclase (GGDEF)-like protein
MKESRLDQLTQINNRHALYHFYEGLKDKTDYYLAIFDIDDFKKVNDEYGHICGDYILKRISKVVSDSMEDEFFCRYGGEEFIIISHLTGDEKTIKKHFDRIRKKIECHEFIFDGTIIPITVTMGVADYKNYQSADRWIDKADEKLYIGKGSGKNIVIM